MPIKEIATEVVDRCRDGSTRVLLDTLYSPDAVSVEATDMGGGRESAGLAAIHAKHDWWESAFEPIDIQISDAMLHGDDRFAVIFQMKVREKATGEVTEMQEVGIYHLADDKIVREEFFY